VCRSGVPKFRNTELRDLLLSYINQQMPERYANSTIQNKNGPDFSARSLCLGQTGRALVALLFVIPSFLKTLTGSGLGL